jgi:outer membrane lipoprotein-sorting protein
MTWVTLAWVSCAGILLADDATQILKTTEDTYRNLKSYQFKGTTTSETKVGTTISKTETNFAVAFKQPNEFLLEYDYPTAGSWVRASDGTTVWNRRSITKESTESPATDDALRILDGSPIAPFTTVTEGVRNVTLVGSEPVAVGGQNFDCYVIEFARARSVGGVARSSTLKLWIDKSRHLVLKQVSESAANGSGTSTENTRTISFTQAEANLDVPDDLFHLSKKHR